jgi:two-component system cell cycle response regulator
MRRTRSYFEPPAGSGLFLAAAATLSVGFLALVFIAFVPAADGAGDFAYFLVMGLSFALCSARVVLVKAERAAWATMALVLLADLSADLLWTYHSSAFPSLADVLWLFSYAFMFIALVLLARERLGRAGWVVLLDGIIATLTISAVAALVLFPTIFAGLPHASLESAATVAYPVGDILVLAAVFVIFALNGRRGDRSWLALIGAAVVWAVGDFVYSYQDAIGTYYVGAPVDLTWPLATMLIALAAWSRVPPPRVDPTSTLRASSLNAFGGLVSLAVVLIGSLTSAGPASFYLALAALGGVGVRLALAQRDNQKLLTLVETDDLTGVSSRGKLFADASAIETAASPVTVAVFDLDGFKFYNDQFGHPAGDRLLHRMATRMTDAARGNGNIYRIGGDEFVAVLWGPRAKHGPVIERISAAMTESGAGFEIRASRGVAEYPEERPDLAAAIALADERMYAAKAGTRTSARNQVHEALVRSIREREPDLAEHTGRVGELTLEVARRFIDDPGDLDVIERAAQLHDVGKIAIPDAILLKPGPLNDEERSLMQQHTLIGERIIAASPALAPAGRLVRHSHEHWDGSGYPDGLSGEDIPLGARIILACDALEAMTSRRPYSEPISEAEAIQELRRHAGHQFDALVVEALIDVLEAEPARA